MMMTVQRNNPKSKKPMMAGSSLAKSATRRASPSFFINIGISQRKMRIQVPKLLAKTMQRSRRDHAEPQKPGKTLPKKVMSILSNVFGSKKSKGSEVEKMGWFKSRGKGSGKCVHCGNKTVGVGSQVALLKPDDRHKVGIGIVPTISRQESSRRLARVSSRVSSRRMARSVRKYMDKERDDEEEREENNGDELCKKRILMGGKCKPVDFSESVELSYF